MYSNRINVFLALSQYLNFSETANRLYMTQSAVSKSIEKLETDLGVKLFERTHKGCVLTVAGEAFLSEAYRMVSISENVKDRMQKLSQGESGLISIAYATELMIDPLAECLRGFTKKHPNVELNFMCYSSISVSRKVVNSEIDLAFGRYESLIKRSGLNWHFVFRDPIYVFMPLDHPLAKEKRITVEMLADETINIVSREVNPGFFDIIQMLFWKKGLTPIMNTFYNDRMSVLFKVRIGSGVTLLTRQWHRTHSFSDVVALPLDEEGAYFDNGIAWRKDNANPAVSLFLDEIIACAGSIDETVACAKPLD